MKLVALRACEVARDVVDLVGVLRDVVVLDPFARVGVFDVDGFNRSVEAGKMARRDANRGVGRGPAAAVVVRIGRVGIRPEMLDERNRAPLLRCRRVRRRVEQWNEAAALYGRCDRCTTELGERRVAKSVFSTTWCMTFPAGTPGPATISGTRISVSNAVCFP